MAFRDREDHGVAGTSGVKFCRAHKVSYVLQDHKVYVLHGHVVKALARHLSVQVAHASSVELDGRDAGGFLDLDGVHIRVNIGLHHRNANLVLDAVYGLDKGGGFAAAGRRHQIEEENAFGFQLFTQGICVQVVILKDTLFNFDNFYRIHYYAVSFKRMCKYTQNCVICQISL